MKILQIVNSLGTGGAEKLLLETIPLYCQKGIEMDILLLDDKKTPFYEQLEALNCCNIYHTLHDVSVYSPKHIRQIAKYLKQYDLVHVHLFPAQYWTVLAKKLKAAKTKLIFTEHSSTNRRLEHRWLKKIDKVLYKYYEKIICITAEIQNIIHQHTGLNKERLPVIQNGVNLQQIKHAPVLEKRQIDPTFKDSDVLLIQVAGFREGKDQGTLVKSLQHLPEQVKVLLVGDGVTRPKIEDLVASLHLQDRVFFLGQRMDVPSLLKSSDIIVLSSDFEGLSLSSIEGMASGKPFVASNVPGLREVVSGAGILFERANERALAEIIQKLSSDKELYAQTVRNCEARAGQYNIDTMVDKHIALYEQVVKA
ncbi:glycosyltransferase [Taibaiella sp. KBW10]|uniref:glycosyltransferase n=1 Tax=Taibaiella sp. KBW10 TaxID=2153357 RepID=UPI000F5B0750|nr:glycosyltransferase [Taibaiella sp. KBW10]RQO31923.1 glycosyltransferase [Taibaiella sp. KBW10]